MCIRDRTTIALKGTIYVTAATPENVADTASNLTVTNQQTEYSKGDQWKKLTDGDTSAEAWVTWNSAGDYSASPTATIDFGSECELSSVTITYGDKAPASAKAEYTTDGETWMQFGSDVKPAAGQTVTFKADKGTVNATKVRIVNTVNNDYMNATEIQAFVTPVQGAAKNIAAASGTNFSVNFQEGASASKAIDGDTTSKGWSTWASTASTVDPVATFTFDEAQTITEVKTFFYYDGRASWPKSQTLEYQDEAGEWHEVGTKDGWKTQAGDAGSGSDGITAADTPTVDFVLDTPVKAKACLLYTSRTLQRNRGRVVQLVGTGHGNVVASLGLGELGIKPIEVPSNLSRITFKCRRCLDVQVHRLSLKRSLGVACTGAGQHCSRYRIGNGERANVDRSGDVELVAVHIGGGSGGFVGAFLGHIDLGSIPVGNRGLAFAPGVVERDFGRQRGLLVNGGLHVHGLLAGRRYIA